MRFVAGRNNRRAASVFQRDGDVLLASRHGQNQAPCQVKVCACVNGAIWPDRPAASTRRADVCWWSPAGRHGGRGGGRGWWGGRSLRLKVATWSGRQLACGQPCALKPGRNPCNRNWCRCFESARLKRFLPAAEPPASCHGNGAPRRRLCRPWCWANLEAVQPMFAAQRQFGAGVA